MVDPDRPHNTLACKSCGQDIVWLKTAKGRNMPVDAATVEIGDQQFDGQRHTSHFATCPEAARHRRAK